jgi:hypothetical protein
MSRILTTALAVMCLFCLLMLGACATTGTAADDGGYSPATSHFWCGQNCTVSAGCEEGLICDCVELFHGGEAGVSEAEDKLWKFTLEELRKTGQPDLTREELKYQSHEVRMLVYRFGGETRRQDCGSITRFKQL